ncbi:MAG: large subunit ribosomal protein L10 [Candidatus Doudnabacteria bacterium Gr01-1014_77]|uniref:Large ribosomal subunit protein uL10 n=1 Tax=Candidatus Doudnabacteria bacterium Gr01-1014_77 TaxID=2017133 RepID=A0A554J9H3_9BACT|nr:MAG: large subunit ribosomal protein L10 [Candidatus Doudnabacteria bacterium Gr01-1014_77]
MTGKKTTHVSKEKKRGLAEISELVKKKRTMLVASIKNIPASQFQEISKKLRGKAIVKVPKKKLIIRAIDASGNETLKGLKEKISDSTAILFSDSDSFDLAAELVNRRSPAKAKTGQEAPEDIEIPAGPTDLVPGPAISELGALGIQIQIDKGKINIKEPKVIVKKGEKISQGASDLMNKLNIKPFTIGFIPIAAFDAKEQKLYLNIKIDREEVLKELKSSFARALPFAVKIGYVSPDTIKLLIQKAGREGMALRKFVKADVSENKINNKFENIHNINSSIPNGDSGATEKLNTQQNFQEENK